jgi:hypothetical protein
MTDEDLKKMTPEERQRLADAEQQALQAFYRNIKEGRRYPRQTQRFALLIILPVALVIIALIMLLTEWLFG